MRRRLITVDDETDPVMQRVRAVQMLVEHSIEGLRVARAELDNEVFALMEARERQRKIRSLA
jgi:hypothetical protein